MLDEMFTVVKLVHYFQCVEHFIIYNVNTLDFLLKLCIMGPVSDRKYGCTRYKPSQIL